MKKRKDDGNHGRQVSKDPLCISDGPITRSRAKKIKKTMQDLSNLCGPRVLTTTSKIPNFRMFENIHYFQFECQIFVQEYNQKRFSILHMFV